MARDKCLRTLISEQCEKENLAGNSQICQKTVKKWSYFVVKADCFD